MSDFIERTDQVRLWDRQHSQRGSEKGLEGEQLVDVPNDAALILNDLLAPKSLVVEVGTANGRDARFWAREGHRVICMDFSRVALGQLVELSERQGLQDRIHPLEFDANTGKLPDDVNEIDAFYSRSALHVDDETLMSLLSDVDRRLKPNGIVVIEGKGTSDPKIARSEQLGNGLAVDLHENGHVRRIWTPESLSIICEAMGWRALSSLQDVKEEWAGTEANFLRLVAQK